MAWDDGQNREMEIASRTAIWFHYGKAAWVLIRDPQGEYETIGLLCTDPIDPQQIAEWFVMRWQMEVTFEEARRHLGVEETQRQ